jgi:hypothetical protein
MFRVYFNRSSDFPYVWSFDDGDIKNEVLVTKIHGTSFVSDYDPSGDNVNTPRGFFWVKASRAVLTDGEVTFYE